MQQQLSGFTVDGIKFTARSSSSCLLSTGKEGYRRSGSGSVGQAELTFPSLSPRPGGRVGHAWKRLRWHGHRSRFTCKQTRKSFQTFRRTGPHAWAQTKRLSNSNQDIRSVHLFSWVVQMQLGSGLYDDTAKLMHPQGNVQTELVSSDFTEVISHKTFLALDLLHTSTRMTNSHHET